MMSQCRVDSVLSVSLLFLAALAGPQVHGSTVVQIGFDEMVSRSDVIVRATVVDKTCFERSMGAHSDASAADRPGGVGGRSRGVRFRPLVRSPLLSPESRRIFG